MNPIQNTKQHSYGFTLIELLVVIAIVGILAAVVLLALNPSEMLRRSRDATRMNDLATINRSISYLLSDGTDFNQSNTICTEGNQCNSSLSNREPDGLGWLPANISSYVATLPTDPLQDQDNVSVSGGVDATTRTIVDDMAYQFTYVGNRYEIRSYLESSNNWEAIINDGGDDDGTSGSPSMFELGTDLTLL